MSISSSPRTRRAGRPIALTCMAAWALLALAASAPGGAQESEGGEEAALLAQAYGSGLQILPIGPYAFTPRHDAPAPAHLSCDFQSGNYCINAADNSDPVLYAPLELPAGALIEDLVCYVKDISLTDDISVALLTRTHSIGLSAFASVGTSGAPGTTIIADTGIGHTVLFKVQNGRTIVPRTYQVSLVLHDDPELAFWGCEVYWKRQVTPAPSTATFDDVPTGHPFFRHIEALAASGLTNGCDADNYCPDAPLNRGQMAVYLAAALGLHWPY